MAVPSLFAVFIFAILQQSSNALLKSNGCQPLSVNNGNVRYAGSNGIQKFSFNCQNGFAPMGKTFSTCLSGQWSNPNPFCVEQSSIKVVENGYMTMTVDNKYIIVCNEGYTLLGSPELKLDGTSSSKCIKTIVNEIKINFPNGNYSVSEDGRTYEFQCNSGLKLFGQSRIQYINNAWTASIPLCLELEVAPRPPVIPNNANINFANGVYLVSEDGRTYEFQCDSGFQLYGEPRIQYINNVWTAPIPLCLASPQQPAITTHNMPIDIINVRKEINFPNGVYSVSEDGLTYEFQCNSGFQLYGQSRIQYINYGWTASIPLCLANCPMPEILNGDIIPDESKNNFKIVCHNGFELFGSSEMSCLYGQWSQPAPLCAADCQPLHINNGVAQNVKNSKVVRVQCNYGYVLNGTQEISCSGGNWSAPTPSCISLCDAVRIYDLPVDRRDLLKFNCNK